MTYPARKTKSPQLICGAHTLSLTRPLVMGVLNVTPDSFSDGGQFCGERAVERALQLQASGADIIDIGGESTRPGAPAVSVAEELDRVIPIVQALAGELRIPISVDTSKAEVMLAAVAAGAGMINDVMALQAPGALAAVAGMSNIAVVLMHMQGEPRTMQANPSYIDVVNEVGEFLQSRVDALLAAGTLRSQIVVDPGIGFGKTLDHNLLLLRHILDFVKRFDAVLVGVSRKSMFSQLLGERPPEQRVAASVQAAMLAAQSGAAILRVHDVQETAEALQLLSAITHTVIGR